MMKKINATFLFGLLFFVCIFYNDSYGIEVYSPDSPALHGIEDIIVESYVPNSSVYSQSAVKTLIERELQDAGISVIDKRRGKITGILSVEILSVDSIVNRQHLGYAVSTSMYFSRAATFKPTALSEEDAYIYPIVWYSNALVVDKKSGIRGSIREDIVEMLGAFIVSYRKANN